MTVNEALSSPEKEKWIDAMEKEMHSIKANKVWELVNLHTRGQENGWM